MNSKRVSDASVETTVSSLAFRATQATAIAGLSSCVIVSRKSDFKLSLICALNAQHSLSFSTFISFFDRVVFLGPVHSVRSRSKLVLPSCASINELTLLKGKLERIARKLANRAPSHYATPVAQLLR
jgi:hypothetical protein